MMNEYKVQTNVFGEQFRVHYQHYLLMQIILKTDFGHTWGIYARITV